MKLSDYVADFIARQGITHVFVITGGASLHLIHSVADHPKLTHICPHHEQSAAMAADAYARTTGNLGAAITTSGPGATNLITGICSAYYDSVPVLYITGQVASFRNKGDTGVRQIGFQETEIVSMVESITNHAVQVTDPKRIRYELERAVYKSRIGRPGPVLVDIPDDIQRMEIDPAALEGFTPPQEKKNDLVKTPADWASQAADLIASAQRPVMILGWGVRLAKAEAAIKELNKKLNFPVLLTWAVADLLPAEDKNSLGTFGTHGTRFANFALQNADLVLSIGCRLDTKATGSPPETFARGAKKIMVEIDQTEIKKFDRLNVKIDVQVCMDAALAVPQLMTALAKHQTQRYAEWYTHIREWENKYPTVEPEYAQEKNINPYVLMEKMAQLLPDYTHIYSDTGCALAWAMQTMRFKPNQRFFHAFNNTPMGWALPAAIGGYYAAPDKPIICLAGDGGFMMNIQELATAAFNKIPVKIFIINNGGYAMIRQTQDQWLGGKYIASAPVGGLGMPDFSDVARAFGFSTVVQARTHTDIDAAMAEMLAASGPAFCEVFVDAAHKVLPQVKFGRPLEDSDPLLPRDEFNRCMLVDPLPASAAA